jgi:UDP-4-amino-4,6-dideoxy-N-acetyl-beta-L-altrosamine N-acetyltransferase
MIIGNLVKLEKPNKDDMQQLLIWRNMPNHRKYYREYKESNIDDQMNWYENIKYDQSWHHFVSKPLDNPSKVIGVAFLNHIHPVYRTGEFGITLGDPDYRGRGYGKDMLLTLIQYGFDELNLNRIWCEVYSNNDSINLYRKIGFKDEGCLRQHVYKNGEYLDSHILGMIRSEYLEKYKTNY